MTHVVPVTQRDLNVVAVLPILPNKTSYYVEAKTCSPLGCSTNSTNTVSIPCGMGQTWKGKEKQTNEEKQEEKKKRRLLRLNFPVLCLLLFFLLCNLCAVFFVFFYFQNY